MSEEQHWLVWMVLGAAVTLALAWTWAHVLHRACDRDLMIHADRLRKVLERSFHGKH